MAINLETYRKEQDQPVITINQEVERDGNSVPFWNREIRLFGKGFSSQNKERLYSDLHTLLDSGLDIQSSLSLISSNFKKKDTKEKIDLINKNIVEGDSFSHALNKISGFSNYDVYSIQIGEETGQLLIVLNELAQFYAKARKYKQMLLSALAYPSFVITFALFVTFFLLKYLVPLFSDVFKKLDGNLPWITAKIIAASNFIQNYGGVIILSIAGLIGIMYFFRGHEVFRKLSSKFLLRIPIIGTIVHEIYLARLCQSMHLLITAQVPLLKTIGLVKNMIDFYPIQHSFIQASDEIMHGSNLFSALEKHKFYPNNFIALIKVGEESSSLGNMFLKLANQYNDSAEQKTALIGSLLEPILIVCLGVLVAFILVAMYMPLFQMSVGIG